MFEEAPGPIDGEGETLFSSLFVVVAVLFCLVMMGLAFLKEPRTDSDRIA